LRLNLDGLEKDLNYDLSRDMFYNGVNDIALIHRSIQYQLLTFGSFRIEVNFSSSAVGCK
jgi:hypothetical protein